MTKRPKGFTFRFSLFTPFIFPLRRSRYLRYLRSENPTTSCTSFDTVSKKSV